MWLLIVTKRLIFRQFLFSYLNELDGNGIRKALVAVEWSIILNEVILKKNQTA